MKKAKKFIILFIVILILVGAVSGGIYAYQNYQKENQQVEVIPVSNLNLGWWGDSMTSTGMVSDSHTQSINIEDNVVAEVKVEEGSEVKIGDPLLVYDTAGIELEMEMKKLELQGVKNDITLAKREIERLKKIKPVASVTPGSPTSSSGKTSGSSANSSSSSKRKEIGTVVVQVKKKDGDAYNYIDTKAKHYAGTGTIEQPFRFLCTQECYVLGEYLNLLVKNEQVASFEIWSGNSVEEGTLLSFWTVNGMEQPRVDKDSKWLVSTQEEMEEEIVLKEPAKEEPKKSTEQKKDTSSKSDDSTEETYTADELKKEIAEKESELKELEIDRKGARLDMKELRKKKKKATVLATINGVVRSVGDPENPPVDGTPFMEISGTEGLYLRGTISELMLDQIEIGQQISANSWSTGQTYTAEITEISEYPSNDRWGYGGEGNPNVSYYSYLAYIEDPSGLSNGEDLEISITPDVTEEQTDSLYIEKAYVRDEDGKSYVLKAGEDGRLVKQYVKTGKILYGSTIEIKSGLSLEDRIAFPYGKTAKEGVKAVESEGF